jgi:hypothetical protein
MPFITYFAGCATDLVAVLRQQGEETPRDGGGTIASANDARAAATAAIATTTGHPRPPVYRRLERVAVTLNEPLSVLWFPRFVLAIGSQGGSRIVQLVLEQGGFCRDDDGDGDGRLDADIDRPSDRDLEQFFGTVLPRHPALRDLHFLRCRIDRHVLRLFADPSFTAPISAAITPAPTSPRIDLRFTETPLDRECAVLLQRMLQGGRIAKLVLELTDADSCRCICEGAAEGRGARLEHLSFTEGLLGVQADTVAAALGPASALTEFDASAMSWTDQAVANAVAALRTNTTLEQVRLVSADPDHLIERHEALFEHLLHTYNFTLVGLFLSGPQSAGGGRIHDLLRRNERIRALDEALQDRGYCVPLSCAVWPNILERVRTFPTLLYRFVRRGNTTALAEQLLASVDAAAAAAAAAAAGPAPPRTRRAKKRKKKRVRA